MAEADVSPVGDDAVGDDPTDLDIFNDEGDGKPAGGGKESADDEDVHDHPLPGQKKEKNEGDDEDLDDDDSDDESDDEEDEEDEEDEGAPEGEKKKGASEDDDEEDEEEEDDDLLKDEKPVEGQRAPKRYDKVFKEHPGLRSAFFQARDFRKSFGTPKDAEDAVEKLTYFNLLENQLDVGDPRGLLNDLARHGRPESLDRLVRSFVPTLEKINPKYANIVALPLINKLLKGAQAEARQHNNQNLERSVDHILKYIHPEGKAEFTELKAPPASEQDPEKEALRQRLTRQEMAVGDNFEARVKRGANRMFDSIVSKAVLSANKEYKAASGRDMSRLEMRALATSVRNRISNHLDRDVDHNQAMNQAWQEAKRRGYADDFVTEVTRTFLRGAKSLLAPALKRELRDALGRKGKKGAPKVPGGGAAHGSRDKGGSNKGKAPVDPRRVQWGASKSGNPDLDFFNDKLPVK